MQRRIFIFCSLLFVLAGSIFAQTSRGEDQKIARFTFGNRSYFPIRRKPTKEQKKQLLPKPEDIKAYEQFLQEPKTGVFRLLPDSDCESNSLIIKATEDCLNAVPESSFYSFREKEHTPEILSDIRLKNDHFISDGILSHGIIVALGDIALENVAPESNGLKFLNNYAPPVSNKQVQKQFNQMTKGVKFGGYEYKKIVPAKENTTYAMRVIAYKGSIFRTFRGFYFDLLAGDKRIDLTVAFRVVERDENGGLTLVWKELNRRKSPRLKFDKRTR